jgi:hypothetical protein
VKKLAAICLLCVIALPAGAVEDGQVIYAGGTVPVLQAGVLGRLDTTSETTLSFEYAGNKLLIPYARSIHSITLSRSRVIWEFCRR